MLRTALRGLVPASAAALFALNLAPEAARADNECDAASSGVATCAATTGNFRDGIRYFVGNADGLTLTIKARENNEARQIESLASISGNNTTGHGIGLFGSHGEGGSLNLVVEGDTNIVGRPNASRDDGIRVRNGIGSSTR